MYVGVAEISGLFTQTPAEMKDRYISLLEKFEVALKINHHQMIIPSLMLEQASYPKPDDVLSDVLALEGVESFYHPPLHRFWLADFVQQGFWPRLICRVATDPRIRRVREGEREGRREGVGEGKRGKERGEGGERERDSWVCTISLGAAEYHWHKVTPSPLPHILHRQLHRGLHRDFPLSLSPCGIQDSAGLDPLEDRHGILVQGTHPHGHEAGLERTR